MTNDELQQELEKTADADGRVTPSGVVAAAKDPEHPLHGEFLWDNKEAAHQHRLEQARGLIRRVPVYLRVEHRGTTRCPYYVRDPRASDHEQGYVALGSVQRASAEARCIVKAEMDRVRAALERAAAITERLGLAGLAEQLESVLAAAAEIQALLLRRDAA